MATQKIKHIVCAIEPNEEAAEVVAAAAHIAQSTGARLTLLHVIEPLLHPYADLNFTPVVEAEIAIERQIAEEARAKIEALAAGCGVPDTAAVLQKGYPRHDVAEQADALGAGLIVMGAHNRRGLQRLLGSTAHATLNATTLPMLAVHPSGNAQRSYDRVLVAVDTSKSITDVLAHATPFLNHAGTQKIISIVQPLIGGYGGLHAASFASDWPLYDMQEEVLATTNTTVRDAVATAGLKEEVVEVYEGDPAHEICSQAEAMPADLLVMGSGRRNVIDRVLLGSTSHAVLNRAPCDIYIVR